MARPNSNTSTVLPNSKKSTVNVVHDNKVAMPQVKYPLLNVAANQASIPELTRYAILIEWQYAVLADLFGSEPELRASDIVRQALESRGFRQQGLLYWGDISVNSVACVLAVTHLAQNYDWFSGAVRSIRLLRVSENSDMLPVLHQVAKQPTLAQLSDTSKWAGPLGH